MKAIIEDGCIACGLCETICPNVFVIKDIAEIVPNTDFEANAEKLKEAAESCPIEIIKIISS